MLARFRRQPFPLISNASITVTESLLGPAQPPPRAPSNQHNIAVPSAQVGPASDIFCLAVQERTERRLLIQPLGQSVVGEKSNYCPGRTPVFRPPSSNATEKEPAAGESFPCTTISSFSCVFAVAVQKRVVRLVSPHLVRARTS